MKELFKVGDIIKLKKGDIIKLKENVNLHISRKWVNAFKNEKFKIAEVSPTGEVKVFISEPFDGCQKGDILSISPEFYEKVNGFTLPDALFKI